MSLVAVLTTLRARANVSDIERAKRVLDKGLFIQALDMGRWVIGRNGIEPSDKEVEIIARDAKLVYGFTVKTSKGKGESSTMIYRLIAPANDYPDFSTIKLCPACRSRSIMEDHDGAGDYCPECGHSPNTKKLVPLEPEAVQAAMFETLGTGETSTPPVKARDAKARAGRAFFESPRRSATVLALEAKHQQPSSLVKLEDRAILLDLLMDAAAHLTQQGQEARYFRLANMNDLDLMLEAQTLAGGIVWRSYLEVMAVNDELEVLA
jgi:hypothetical protein